MAKSSDYVFGKHEDFDLEHGSPLSTKVDEVFKLKRYDIYYSEKYECAMLVMETQKKELLYSMSEVVTDRFVKAVNLGLKVKGALLVLRVIEGANGDYHRLEQPTTEEVNDYNKRQFTSNTKKEDD